MRHRSTILSQKMQRRANELIAHGALTNSKHPQSLVAGVYPTHLTSAHKCYVTDVDDNRYIDFICGLGTNLFGYGNPDIGRRVADGYASAGAVLSLATVEEVELAEKLQGTFPFLERMRFLKTGSEGCSAAIRIARAYTGRNFVYSEGYHGWHDEFVSLTDPAIGIPQRTTTFIGRWNMPLHLIFKTKVAPAAFVIEPVELGFSEQRITWLHELRKECTEHGVVLIFDETITAYRFKDFSVARATGVTPDLWIGGKAIAGGLPLSVIGGKREIMESEYFVSSTWAGDRLAIAAALKANELVHGAFHPNELWDMGKAFLEQFNALSPRIQIKGYPTRGSFEGESRFKALFWQECCKAGVLFGPSWFYNKFLHAEMENVISICKSAIQNIEDGKVRLEGKLPVSPFAQRVRDASKSP